MTNHAALMKSILNRLFASEGDAFTAQVNFRSGYSQQGVITREYVVIGDIRYDALKLATPTMISDPARPHDPRSSVKGMAELYFAYEDVEAVLIARPVDASKIIGDAAKPSIILGDG
jgi:hypothetical protein